MDNTCIELRNVSVLYGENEVLDEISLTIQEGEFITVIGSSGCGKTTLLKLVNGILKPNRGTVAVNGEDISKSDLIKLRRKIGYVIQDVGLFPHLNIEKNISYVPDLEKKKEKNKIKKRTGELLHLVGLEEEMLRRYPSELSGGQRQRVGIARALMASPKLLLMDEPFGAVDEITRRKLQDEIKQIHETLKNTILFVTHDIREAVKLGDRVIVMDKGKIVQFAKPKELIEFPANKFVENLLCMEPANTKFVR